jgi:2,4-dienoyl-CoA reductase-like NADH-dependent reductase (Old Yellow Enzyme family)
VTRTELPDPGWPTADEAARARLFSPIDVGPARLPARTWVPAMVPWRASDDGEVTDDVLDWYGRFAAGRPAVIVVEATGIRDVPSGPLLRIGHDRFVPGLMRLVERVRAASGGATRLFVQLIDFLSVRRRPEPERWFRRFFAPSPAHHARAAAHLGRAPASQAAAEPSLDDAALVDLLVAGDDALHAAVLTPRELEDLRFGARERVTDLHLPHVRALPAVLPGLFADAARRAWAAGFDGVELHYAHAYTMASFLSRTNTRDDGYGGDLAGRLRLPLEVIHAVRAATPADRVLGARMLGDEAIAGGTTLDESPAIAVALAQAGLDFVSVSKGGKFDDAKQPKVGAAVYPYTGPSGHECMPTVWLEGGPWGRNLALPAAIRAALRAAGLGTPVVGAGGLSSFRLAEDALAAGALDLVASARQSLADPDWFEKVRVGRGHEVRRCVATNYCEGLDQKHAQVTCRLWDRAPITEADPSARAHDGKRRLVAPRWVVTG